MESSLDTCQSDCYLLYFVKHAVKFSQVYSRRMAAAEKAVHLWTAGLKSVAPCYFKGALLMVLTSCE